MEEGKDGEARTRNLGLCSWVKDCKCNTVGGNQQVEELAMRPTARGMAQHGGPPGWLEENDRCSSV
jgi:hypothetical protein